MFVSQCCVVAAKTHLKPVRGRHLPQPNSDRFYFLVIMSKPFKDYSGIKFEKLTAISRISDRKRSTWIFNCDCGKSIITSAHNVIGGGTRSCGCLRPVNNNLPIPKQKPDTPLKYLFYDYKKSAIKRGYLFALPIETFKELTSSVCHYCGALPSNVKINRKCTNISKYSYIFNGIDRLNNHEGYVIQNCVPCCEVCNRSKRAMKYESFINYLNQLTSYRTKLNEQL